MEKKWIIIAIICIFINLKSQYSIDAKRIVNLLCSNEFGGRGYVNNGANKAAKFIADELFKNGARSTDAGFYQKFIFNVNVIQKAVVIINQKRLIPGKDFICNEDIESMDKLFLAPKGKTIFITEKLLNNKTEIDKVLSTLPKSKKSKNYFVVFDTMSNAVAKIKKETIQKFVALKYAIIIYEKVKTTYSVATSQSKNVVVTIPIEVANKYGFYKFETALDIETICDYKTTTQQNVIGYIKGTKNTDSSIIICAHYDHLGMMDTAIFRGANDNACGTAMLIKSAEYFSKNKPLYNVYFIAFAGEEAGLIGSDYFTTFPTFDISKTRFVFNLDLMAGGETGATVVNATIFKKEFALLDSTNKEIKALTTLRRRNKAANSDHHYFTEKNIPSFFMYLSGPRGAYHDVTDVPETLNYENFDKTLLLICMFLEKVQRQ